jgi:hypothetical protein
LAGACTEFIIWKSAVQIRESYGTEIVALQALLSTYV